MSSFLTHARHAFRDLGSGTELTLMLLKRNLKTRYRQTYLGYVWGIIPPLAMALVWIFLKNASVIEVETGAVSYPVFAVTGIILWQTFSDSLLAPIQAVQNNKTLLSKIYFRRESLFFAGFLEVLVDFSIKLLLLAILLIYFQQALSWHSLVFMIGSLAIVMFGYGIGMLLVPIGALFTDIDQGLNVILGILFFLTPVVYKMPEEGIAATIIQSNPVTYLLDGSRSYLLLGHYEYWSGLLYLGLISVFLCILGLTWIRIAMPHIISRLGS